MKSYILIPIIIVIAGGAYFFTRSQGEPATDNVSYDSTRPTAAQTPDTDQQTGSRYVNYSPSAFEAATGSRRVLFFHAPWCPTCRPADAAFRANTDRIPEDVILFKTDYDSETELKKRYNITYQHTYVLVDANGKEIKKWNGGGIDELVSNTK